jgi:hypothetical protein
MIRRILLVLLAAAPGVALAAGEAVELYRDPGCGCCGAHAEYLRGHGYEVEVIATDDIAGVKSEHGVPRALASCHTALIEGYVVEGHVPADSIERLLAEQPDVIGISVPGMPVGSPGMGMEHGLREPLQVWTIPASAGERPQLHAIYQRLDG